MASTITSDSELEEGSSSNLNVSPLKRGRSSTSYADCDDDDPEDEPSDTDTEEIVSKRRFNGAAIYKTKYQHSWERTWSYIRPVKGNPHAFYCKVCMKSISCAYQGERDISHHAESAQHKKFAKAMKHTQPLPFTPSDADPKQKVCIVTCT